MRRSLFAAVISLVASYVRATEIVDKVESAAKGEGFRKGEADDEGNVVE